MGTSVRVLPAGLAESATTRGTPTGPTNGTEKVLADVLADVLAGVVGVERVPVDGHFFDDLGADSLVMAQFCARVRKRPDLPSVSMKDIYQHPTISTLAAALAGFQLPARESALGRSGQQERRSGDEIRSVGEGVMIDDTFEPNGRGVRLLHTFSKLTELRPFPTDITHNFSIITTSNSICLDCELT